jgi:hypothetical protein
LGECGSAVVDATIVANESDLGTPRDFEPERLLPFPAFEDRERGLHEPPAPSHPKLVPATTRARDDR